MVFLSTKIRNIYIFVFIDMLNKTQNQFHFHEQTI